MKWPALRTKKFAISPQDCDSCDMCNVSHGDVGKSRKGAGSKQAVMARSCLSHGFSCCV